MVELWPFLERAHGITVFQLFGRLAGFFTTFVNPIGMANVKWKYPHFVLLLAGLRDCLRLLYVSRDIRPHSGGVGILYVNLG